MTGKQSAEMGWMVQRAASVLLFCPVSQLKKIGGCREYVTAGADLFSAPAVFMSFPAHPSRLSYQFISPSPPMRRVISSMRSIGNGGALSGRMAMLISFIGLSSAAMRLDERAPQRRQR